MKKIFALILFQLLFLFTPLHADAKTVEECVKEGRSVDTCFGLYGSGDETEGYSEFSLQDLNNINPLNNSTDKDVLSTPGDIISRVLDFAFPIAGMILFVMIFWGGFEMLSGAASKKSMDAGKQRITAAVIGFFILFTSYWVVRIVEEVFGLKIL